MAVELDFQMWQELKKNIGMSLYTEIVNEIQLNKGLWQRLFELYVKCQENLEEYEQTYGRMDSFHATRYALRWRNVFIIDELDYWQSVLNVAIGKIYYGKEVVADWGLFKHIVKYDLNCLKEMNEELRLVIAKY